MPVRNLIILCISMSVSMLCYKRAIHNRFATMIGESIDVIKDQYVEEVDDEKLFEDAMSGMVSGLDDYSSFIMRSEFSQFQSALDQRFGGIGIVVELPTATKRLTVLSPVVGTPAFRAGLRAGDIIYEIDGQDTLGMTLKDSVKLMRGLEGSTIKLKFRHAAEEKFQTAEIARAEIPIESVHGDSRRVGGAWNFHLEDHPTIGYIRLSSFGDKTAAEVRAALEEFEQQPVDGLILDVRNNAGGLLSTAVELCDMFVPEGKIVSIRGRHDSNDKHYYARNETAVALDMPMVVMTNNFSASASEILAACLQDHDRAIVVGERSFGKGTVQNVIEMQGGQSALKLTTASYWRPSGQNIHRHKDATDEDSWGVSPNEGMEVPLKEADQEKVIERMRSRDVVIVGDEPDGPLPPVEAWYPPASDPQIEKAVDVLKERIEQRQNRKERPQAA